MSKSKKVYRFVVERHYIAVQWYDVLASSPATAAALARNTAQKLRPDPRAEATDNHWQTDEPVIVPSIGHHANGNHHMLCVGETKTGSKVYRASLE